jgi:hypothetical protein
MCISGRSNAASKKFTFSVQVNPENNGKILAAKIFIPKPAPIQKPFLQDKAKAKNPVFKKNP